MPAFSSPITLYLPERQVAASDSARLASPLLRALESEDVAIRQALRRTNDPDAADAVVLPYVWRFYTTSQRHAQAVATAQEAAVRGQSVMVWHAGDLRPHLPFSNYLLFRNATDRSSREPTEYCVPPFIEDPLPDFSAGRLALREKCDRPSVGFCGYAIRNPVRLGYTMLLNTAARLRYWVRGGDYEPPNIYPAARFRAKVLGRLAADRRLATRFIRRRRYRAGVRTSDRSHPTVQEFYRNIIETDYTICIRGYGNWSVRLYETLACGRIPVLIDTDCGLPYDLTVDWKRYCVWIPATEWRSAGDRIVDFHARLSPSDFVEKQRECRRFWEERLTFHGFFGHFSDHVVSKRSVAAGAACNGDSFPVTGPAGHLPERRLLRLRQTKESG